MGCFPCSGGGESSSANKKKNQHKNKNDDHSPADAQTVNPIPNTVPKVEPKAVTYQSVEADNVVRPSAVINPSEGNFGADTKPRKFKLQELVVATDDFKDDYFLGEGGFGKVYKGRIPDSGEIVAIKRLDKNGCQGIREFLVEVLTLGQGQHENLVKLIGCCAEGDQRLLVYEFMPLGSLEDHLHDYRFIRNGKPLDWNTRMKIAAGAARGLEYLHTKMNPPIIYRDLKGSNILLGEGFHPKLSDFGLAKVGPLGDQTHVSTRVMGTYGYCAPDYAMTGQLTFKSDIYSFGVVLLELISGRRAIDNFKSGSEKSLVHWAKPLFKDRKKFHRMADPVLEGRYPTRGLFQALAIAAMCVQEEPNLRPNIGDIVTALNYLASHLYDPNNHSAPDSAKKLADDEGKKLILDMGKQQGVASEDERRRSL